MNNDNKFYLIYINIFIILISLLLINCQQEKRETTPNIPNTTNISVIDTIPIGYVWLKVGEKKLLVEIADTPEKRREGLMFRQELEENAEELRKWFLAPDASRSSTAACTNKPSSGPSR